MFLRGGWLWMLILVAGTLSAQKNYKNRFELSVEQGYSGILGNPPQFGTFANNSKFDVLHSESGFTRGFLFSYSRQLFGIHSIKTNIGVANFSFHYEGRVPASSTPAVIIRDTYKVRYLELGIAYSIRLKTFNAGSIQLEIGPSFHSDADRNVSFSPNAVSFLHKDAYSLVGYLGFETPMFAHKFFVNAGLTFKHPLGRYDRNLYETLEPFLPYFVGFRTSINYQF